MHTQGQAAWGAVPSKEWGNVAGKERGRTAPMNAPNAPIKDYRNRTDEFQSIARCLQETTNVAYAAGNVNGHQPRHNSNSDDSDTSNVQRAAATIKKGLQDLVPTLARMAKLARSRSNFEDPTAEFNDLHAGLTQHIRQRGHEIKQLQQFIDSLDCTTQQRNAYEQIIGQLSAQLSMAMNEAHEAGRLRAASVKEMAARRNGFESGHAGFETNGTRRRPRPDRIVTDTLNPTFVPYNNPTLQQEQMQRDHYYQDRVNGVEQLTGTISEISGMMTTLVTKVVEQDEVIVSINSHLDDAVHNLDSGNDSLMQYYNRLTGQQWLIIKLFAVIIALSVFLIIFMK